MTIQEPRRFHVESVEIPTPVEVAFAYISDTQNLPSWTHAFKEVARGKALMETPGGSVEVGIEVKASQQFGTIDWFMTMPDGKVAAAFSRLAPLGSHRAAYSFVLLAPPVPLAQIEGSLNQQVVILRQELAKLTGILGAKSHVA